MASANLLSILSKNTSLTEEQVNTLLESNAQSSNEKVEDFLSEKNHSTIDDLILDFAKAIGMEFLKEIPINDISATLVQDLPINYAKTHEVLPYKDDKESLQVLCTNPLNHLVFNDLRIIFSKRIVPILTTSPRIQEAINRVYEKSTSALEGLDEIEGEDYDLDEPIIDLLEAADDEAPVIKLVNTLIFRAVKEKASDIHIEPYEKDMVVRFRIDGILFDIFKPPKKLQNAITSRIKVMGNLNIAEKRLPQDGRIPLKVGNKDIDIRLNSIPTVYGERLVLRLQDRSNVILELEQLGFSENSLTNLDDLLHRTYGILIVTGPTGSGKSTTLYAGLQRINSVDKNIVTVEDPVENRIHGIGQVQTNTKIGLTFASALRAFLRQDPDIIMIGEIRDLETAEIAINASMTGHLVLSTLHTNDAAGAFPRLIDMGCEPFLIATSLLGVVGQRLVRVLCPHCKEPHTPTDFHLQSLGITRKQAELGNICKAVGCSHCNQKGYIGRTVIQELLLVTDEVRSLIMQRVDANTIKAKAIEQGMITFREHGLQKILNGITTIEELLSNTQMDI